MKNKILRILIGAILITIMSAIVVSIIGLKAEWKTSIQFSDGFFWAATIVILIGFISYYGYRRRATDWPPINVDPANRSKLWAADNSRGKILLLVFGISGLMLIGLSILISSLF